MYYDNSAFEAIKESPYLSAWGSGTELLPDEELMQYDSLPKLRLISSKILKSNPIAQAFQIAYVSMLLGGKMFTKIEASDSMEKRANEIITQESKFMDINKRYSKQMMFEQVIASAFEHGDILFNLPMDKDRGDIETYLELIIASRICTPREYENNALIRNGVEYHSSGKLKGYWVKNVEAMDQGYNSKDAYTFLPSFVSDKYGQGRMVSWLFKAPLNLKPNQSRQYPLLTSGSKILRFLQQYVEAVVIGARVAACFAGFIKTSNPTASKETLNKTNKILENIGKIQPGTIYLLKRGDEVDFASPSRPPDNSGEFIKTLTMMAAASIRLPYSIAMLDLVDTNYSSWKGGTNEIRQNMSRWWTALAYADEWITRTILLEAITKRMLKGSLKNVQVNTMFPRYTPLDDEKKARANKLNLQNKTTSQTKLCEENDIDWDQLQPELDKEAIRETEREALVLAKKKEFEQEFGIIFPEGPTTIESSVDEPDNSGETRDTSGSRREGEQTGEDLDPDDARERRIEDGNY